MNLVINILKHYTQQITSSIAVIMMFRNFEPKRLLKRNYVYIVKFEISNIAKLGST